MTSHSDASCTNESGDLENTGVPVGFSFLSGPTMKTAYAKDFISFQPGCRAAAVEFQVTGSTLILSLYMGKT
jgi:hypothetical protein